jgi:hypothetical protein
VRINAAARQMRRGDRGNRGEFARNSHSAGPTRSFGHQETIAPSEARMSVTSVFQAESFAMYHPSPFQPAAAAAVLATVLAATAGIYASSAHGEASPSAIYRCKQPDGGMGYQDFPCSGGVLVNIRPGVANPQEIARLARDQEAFERAAAARKADELIELRREELMLRRQQLEASSREADASGQDNVYYPAYGFGGFVDNNRRFSHSPRHDHVSQRPTASTGRVPAAIQRPRAR